MKKIFPLMMLVIGLMSFTIINNSMNTMDNNDPKRFHLPSLSPSSMIIQEVGYTSIAIKYQRRKAQGRKIFGNTLPYGKVWNLGDDATAVITLSHDVKIEGKDIKAGSYALFVIPKSNKWELIFAKDLKDGVNEFDESNIITSIKLETETVEKTESLSIIFDNITHEETTMYIDWGIVSVGLTIDIKHEESVWTTVDRYLKSIEDKSISITRKYYLECANYASKINEQNQDRLSTSMNWYAKSSEKDPNAENIYVTSNPDELDKQTAISLKVKANLEARKGNFKEAIKYLEEALELDNNPFENEMKESIKAFKAQQ